MDSTMSLQAITWAFDRHDTTPTQRLLLLAYADCANQDDEAWPKVQTLIEKTGFSQATIYRTRGDLVDDEYMEKLDTKDHYRLLTGRNFSQGEKVSQSEKSTNKGTQKNPKGSEDVDSVWTHYVETMRPRAAVAGEDERRIIREALKVASVDECKRAITGCARSPFHMGENDKRKKYNALSQILRGKRGRQTVRERIDYFIGLADEGGVVSGLTTLPSDQRANVMLRVRDVQRGHGSDDPEVVQRATEAENWLRERGIETVRDAAGAPTFPSLAD